MLQARPWQSKSKERFLDFSRSISFFFTATKILLTFVSWAGWQHRFYITKVGNGRKDGLEGYAPFCFIIFFLQKIFAQSTSLFYLYLHLKPIEKCFFFRQWVAWSWHNIQISSVSCILFPWLRVKFDAREANSRWRSVSSNPDLAIEFVFFFTFVLSFFSFLFFPSFFQDFSRSNAHTLHQGRCEETRKGRKETKSSSLHSICGLQINVWLGEFI